MPRIVLMAFSPLWPSTLSATDVRRPVAVLSNRPSHLHPGGHNYPALYLFTGKKNKNVNVKSRIPLSVPLFRTDGLGLGGDCLRAIPYFRWTESKGFLSGFLSFLLLPFWNFLLSSVLNDHGPGQVDTWEMLYTLSRGLTVLLFCYIEDNVNMFSCVDILF